MERDGERKRGRERQRDNFPGTEVQKEKPWSHLEFVGTTQILRNLSRLVEKERAFSLWLTLHTSQSLEVALKGGITLICMHFKIIFEHFNIYKLDPMAMGLKCKRTSTFAIKIQATWQKPLYAHVHKGFTSTHKVLDIKMSPGWWCCSSLSLSQ